MPYGAAQFVPTFYGRPGTYVLVKKDRLTADSDTELSFMPMMNNHGPVIANVLPMQPGLPGRFNLSPDHIHRYRSIPTFFPI